MTLLDIICEWPAELEAGNYGYNITIEAVYDPKCVSSDEEPAHREEIREAFSAAFELVGDGSHIVLFSDEIPDIED